MIFLSKYCKNYANMLRFLRRKQMTAENALVLARFYEITGIPMCVMDGQGKTALIFPSSGVPLLNERLVSLCFREFESPGHNPEHPLVLAHENVYYIGFAKLTEEEYLVFGPSRQSRTYRLFANALSVVIQLYPGKSIPPEDIILSNATPPKQETETVLREWLFSQREHVISHTEQSFELGIIQAVEAGDSTLLKRRLTEPVTGRVGQMAKNPLSQERYTFIAFVTLLTRAAIRGGLDSEVAFSLSDAYCQQMDSMTRVQDISALLYRMAIDFCQKVAQEGKGARYSSRIQKLRDYISTHLHEDISLADLSATSGLCSRNLSKKFREAVGISIADYIHQQKMREAAHLLLNSDYDIAGIAGFLNYSSQSYFTKVFHDIYELTPKQYRENRQGERCTVTK
jgi:AraC-like DNA-binding protein